MFSLVLKIVMLHQLRHLKQVALKKVIFSVADGPIFATLPVGMLSKLIKMMFLGGFIFHIGNERGDQILQKDIVAVIAVLSVCTLGNDDTCEVS